jgi:hypothetical protein
LLILKEFRNNFSLKLAILIPSGDVDPEGVLRVVGSVAGVGVSISDSMKLLWQHTSFFTGGSRTLRSRKQFRFKFLTEEMKRNG